MFTKNYIPRREYDEKWRSLIHCNHCYNTQSRGKLFNPFQCLTKLTFQLLDQIGKFKTEGKLFAKGKSLAKWPSRRGFRGGWKTLISCIKKLDDKTALQNVWVSSTLQLTLRQCFTQLAIKVLKLSFLPILQLCFLSSCTINATKDSIIVFPYYKRGKKSEKK